MITEAVRKTAEPETRARGFNDLPALHEHIERTTSELTPIEKREFAIWMRVQAEVLTKQTQGVEGQAEQPEAEIPAYNIEDVKGPSQ